MGQATGKPKVNQWTYSNQFNISAGQGAYLINYSYVKQVATGKWQAASGKRQETGGGRRHKSRASNAKSRVIILHFVAAVVHRWPHFDEVFAVSCRHLLHVLHNSLKVR